MHLSSENGVPQHEGMIVVPIRRRINEGDRALVGTAAEIGQPFCVLGDFVAVSAAELVPMFGSMAEPGAQLCAWGDLLDPVVKLGVRLADPARPQTIDENSDAIRSFGRIVGALQPYVRSSDLPGDDSGHLRKQTRRALRGKLALEFDFGAQPFKVAVNNCHGPLPAIAQIGD